MGTHAPCSSLQAYMRAIQSKITNQQTLIKGNFVILQTQGKSGPGKSASVQIYSSNAIDPSTGKGKLSQKAHLKHGKSKKNDDMKTITYKIKLYTEREFGIPGAFLITNHHKHEFFLESATLEVLDNHIIHFDCRSWVYPVQNTKSDRLFFSNTSYLPKQTPSALLELRKSELKSLRGDGTGERKEWDRIYDYDYYNNLGRPDKDQKHSRPILGGSESHPYPRRGRTGLPISSTDPSTKSRPEIINLDTYVPPDERLGPKKLSEFISNSVQAAVHFLIPEANSLLKQGSSSFKSFEEISNLFSRKRYQIEETVKDKLKKMVTDELFKDIIHASKQSIKFPLPQIITEDDLAWRDDEEFGHQMLAGVNPARIRCLQDREISRVFLPATQGTQAALWQLAKAHVAANDSAYHQLISHWLHTHAVVEPFIIATRRQLSVMHPIHRLLDPHLKHTMHINALARSILINSGGILEKTLFTGEISVELSSELYKEWRFDEQALPADLLKRRLALKDPDNPITGVQLLFEDYPYGADGLEIWGAIKTWVRDFCSIFYKDDDSVSSDIEIQEWWSEIKNVGHGDKGNETWWYEMTTLTNLIEALTTLIWIASALHASVNFGQYAYASYPPNRPMLCRRFIPREGEKEFAEFLRDPDKYYLNMLPERFETTLGIALTAVLSQHSSDEMYLGQRPSGWTDNKEVGQKFEKFKEDLKEIEKKISTRNANPNLKNRWGPAKIPYKLLHPDTSNVESKAGITNKGIPSSITI